MKALFFTIMALCATLQATVYAATPITFGQNIRGRILCSTDELAFTADAGDRVLMFFTECQDLGSNPQNGCSVACCCFDQYIELQDAGGATIASGGTGVQGNCCGCQARTRLGEWLLGQGGEYRIVLHDNDNWGNGTYSIYLQRTNNPGEPGGSPETLAYGETRLKNINTCGDVMTFVFQAAQGDNVRVSMVSAPGSGVNPMVELYDSQGRIVTVPSGVIDRFIAPTAGRYTLIAYSAINETGFFRITLDLLTSVEASTWGQIKSVYR